MMNINGIIINNEKDYKKGIRRAETLAKQVQNKIYKKGAYENAGEKERFKLEDELSDMNLNYQEKCLIKKHYYSLIDRLDYSRHTGGR